jgi:hypothetical protein
VQQPARQGRAVVTQVKGEIAAQVAPEQADEERVADLQRKPVDGEHPEQVHGVGEQHEDHERAAKSQHERALAGEVQVLIQSAQDRVALDRIRIGEHGEERHDGCDTPDGGQGHEHREQLQTHELSPLCPIEQSPYARHDVHGT